MARAQRVFPHTQIAPFFTLDVPGILVRLSRPFRSVVLIVVSFPSLPVVYHLSQCSSSTASALSRLFTKALVQLLARLASVPEYEQQTALKHVWGQIVGAPIARIHTASRLHSAKCRPNPAHAPHATQRETRPRRSAGPPSRSCSLPAAPARPLPPSRRGHESAPGRRKRESVCRRLIPIGDRQRAHPLSERVSAGGGNRTGVRGG